MNIKEINSDDVAEFQPAVEGVSYNEEGTPVLDGINIEKPSAETYEQAKNNVVKAIHEIDNISSTVEAKKFLSDISADLRNVILGSGEIDEKSREVFDIDVVNPICKIGGEEGDKFEAVLVPSSGITVLKLSNAGLDENLRPVDGVELTLPIDSNDNRYEQMSSTITRLDEKGNVALAKNINDLSGKDLDFFKNCLQSSLTAVSMASKAEVSG